MNLKDVYRVEQEKWDKLAAQRQDDLLIAPDADFAQMVSKSPLMVGIAEFLGDVAGLHVLDYGCGLGMTTTLLARSGAQVSAFDLSPMSISVARERARVNGVADRVKLTVAAGEHLPYASESFDVVFGKAILHHLNVELGRRELYRVLKPGGKAVFVEPMGMNPLLNFVRAYVPYPNKKPRGADVPLTYKYVPGGSPSASSGIAKFSCFPCWNAVWASTRNSPSCAVPMTGCSSTFLRYGDFAAM